MLPDTYYYRDPGFLYPLVSHPDYWFHVGASASEQVILGLLGQGICVLRFDRTGDLLKSELRSFQALGWTNNGPDALGWLDGMVERAVRAFRYERRLADRRINIKRFRLPGLGAGIDDLPDELGDYARRRALQGVEDRELEERIVAWNAASLFVFWWGEDFYVDNQGLVTSS